MGRILHRWGLGREVYGSGLQNRRARMRSVGSNPAVPADDLGQLPCVHYSVKREKEVKG